MKIDRIVIKRRIYLTYKASLIFFVVVVLALSVRLAFALSITPAGPESSGFLDTNGATITSTTDGWWEIVDPNGVYCDVFHGNPGGDFGPLTNVYLFGPDDFATYFDGFSHGNDCSPGAAITDWTIDGTWTFRVYNSSAMTSVAEETTFVQGGGGGGASSTDILATSTIEQTQQNLFNAMALFLTSMFFVTWFFKRRL